MTQWLRNSPANAGDAGDKDWVPEPGRSPGGGNGNPLPCSCRENPMDSRAWQSTVHGVAKESDMTECACTHTHTHTHTQNSFIFRFFLRQYIFFKKLLSNSMDWSGKDVNPDTENCWNG